MNECGQLSIVGNTLCYAVREREVWRIPVAEIRIIGECNPAWGPFADDYFLVFAADNGVPLVASYYADGARQVIEELGQMGMPLQLTLEISPTWNSLVVYPNSLAGRPMLELVDPPVEGWRSPLVSGLGLRNREAILAAGPREYLRLGTRSGMG